MAHLDESDLKYLVEHIFLPPKLPQNSDPETHRHDGILLDYVTLMSKTFFEILSTTIDKKGGVGLGVWCIIFKMLETMGTLYNDGGGIVREKLEAVLKRMEVSDVLPVFVEAQNAAIIFRKIAVDKFTFETFEVSLPCDMVIKTQGKITMRFPTNPRLPFPAENAVLSTLANVLAHLSTSLMMEATPVSKKGGDEHYEFRDTASPRFITEALAGIIRATPPSDSAAVDTVYVQKRLDDRVLWKSALKPWRRSSMWLVIRVAMQTTLEQWGVGPERGYKAFQAVLMASILDRVTSGDPDKFPCELLTFMSTKLVRRLCKLDDVLEGPYALTIRSACDAVGRASTAVGERWKELQQHHESTLQWMPPPSTVNPIDCLEFSFPHSQAVLSEISKRHDQVKGDIPKFDGTTIEESWTQPLQSRTPLSSSQLPVNILRQEVGIALHDVENWIRIHLQGWETSPLRSEQDCLPLSSLMDEYRKSASHYYKGDPERISLMHLCILELWVALDRICIKWCPLLQGYSPEIAQNLADPLLLPYLSQMRRLALVQLYLDSRHQFARGNGSLSIFRHPNTEESFPNQYFKCPNAIPLIALEERIKADAMSRKAVKTEQLLRCRDTYNDLMAQAYVLECLGGGELERNENGIPLWKHAPNRCQKCLIEYRASALRVIPMEDSLPQDMHHARPIVFELDCPVPFSIWRDATIKVILSTTDSQPKTYKKLYPLCQYTPLKDYYNKPYRGSRISFASTAKSLTKSHYSQGVKMPAVESQVFFQHKGSFDVFDADANSLVDTGGEPKLRTACTFQLDGLYAPLQPFVDNTLHPPNSVLTSLSKCPIGVSPAEYTTFGLLRAGNRLQWRNIMRAIKAQTLPFSDAGVFLLIAQSIWQAGPVGEGVDGEHSFREAHIDLLDERFGTQVTAELLRAVKSLGSNWKQTNSLAVLIILALRVQEFTPHTRVQFQARRVLSQARTLALEWIKNLLEAQLQPSECLSEQSIREPNNQMAQAIANVALVLQASFDAESDDYAKAFRCNNDVVMYIYTARLISAVQAQSFPPGLRVLASRNHRLALRVEPHVLKACFNNPSILNDVVALAYPGYFAGVGWTPLPAYGGRWWTARQSESDSVSFKIFHMNIMEGSFLINGKSIDQLPATYRAHPFYVNLFNDHVFRVVRPSNIQGMQYKGHYGAYEVHFGMIGQTLTVVRQRDVELQEYIRKDSLEEDLPLTFSTDHCFWYSKSTGTIQIRRLSQAWAKDDNQHWKIHLRTSTSGFLGRIERQIASSTQSLVSLSSQIYRMLVRTLAPLEPNPRGLLVTVLDSDTTKISVYLPRHDLTFSLHQNQLECISLPGYVLESHLSGIGCLFGLKSILNLRHCDLCRSGRKVIVPKGTMVIAPGRYGHIDTSIDVGFSKGYFVYDVDEELGRLVGTRTMESDLYLAKLHAFTASPLPDPLTQQTGTTEALERLSNAASFSFHAVSRESQSYLEDMIMLTPTRSFYPTHLRVMETVEWNEQLPVCVQHPEFRSRVKHILSSWRTMEIFLPVGDLSLRQVSPRGSSHLNDRATYRGWLYSSPSDPQGYAIDLPYNGRDSLSDSASRDRENVVFQASVFVYDPLPGLSPCRNLQAAVTRWNKVKGVQGWGWNSIPDWLSVPTAVPIADTWGTFYELCRNAQSPTFEILVALAFQSFRGVPLELIAILGAVLHESQFSVPKFFFPMFSAIELSRGTFNHEIALMLVLENRLAFEHSEEYNTRKLYGETEAARLRRANLMYTVTSQKEAEALVDRINTCWPRLRRPPMGLPLRIIRLSKEVFKDTIEPRLITWAQNRAFLSHIEVVQHHLNALSAAHCLFQGPNPVYSRYEPLYPPTVRGGTFSNPTLQMLMRERTPGAVDALVAAPLCMSPKPTHEREKAGGTNPVLEHLESVARNPLEIEYLDNLRASWDAFRSHSYESKPSDLSEGFFQSMRSINLERTRVYLEHISRCLQPSKHAHRMMQLVGIWPRVTPQALLRCLSLKRRTPLSSLWVTHLSGYAISIHDVKRANRMLQLAQDGMQTLLKNEVRHFRGWQPLEFPDWLLVEIESDLSIRPAQATVAYEMLDPYGNQNTVMQLNMGEGKSSVIVPIVAVSASNGSNLARVIVPRTQMKQQFHIMRRTLTGLCDRRIVYLPFNRDLELEASSVTQVHRLLRDGAKDGAIWICEPEHLLSLKMLGIDKAMRSIDHYNCARNLIELNSWLHHHTKDILDESDEVLDAKQQVIYTVGPQQSLNSAPLRWEVVQKLLGLLAIYLTEDTEDKDLSSFLIEPARTSSAFPGIRIQSGDARHHLRRFLAASIHNSNWPVPPHMNDSVIDFVTSADPSDALIKHIRSYCSDESASVMQTVLILRGLIGSDVLMHSLKERRWRVQYGLDLRRSRLAIPFRAKDSPSPRSEFGHPDVIILLTCLSYYYAGLDLEMVTQVLQSLVSSEAPEVTYANWVRPCWEDIPSSLRTINGINLQDEEPLRAQLFPFLRYNKAVIDFYLNVFIFPTHAKEFPSKISTSGWDIAMQKPNPTTGFSGTNDGRFLLPVTIKQTDRDAQLHTNAKVLACILEEENCNVVHYPNFIGAISLLDRIHSLPSRPTVILDVGAQILDMSNEAFSRIWLKMYQDNPVVKAAVFFDEWDNLLALTPDGIIQALIDSPYSNRLDQCLVYLDEAHTRGTDLRIPPNTQAVVTLGPKLNKDKLVQGCMRMRRLGDGHTLVFMASEEVVKLIHEATGSNNDKEITTESVVIWSIMETWKQLQANLPVWVLQGHSFVRREAAWETVSAKTLPSSRELTQRFCEREARTIEELYGTSSSGTAHWIWDQHSIESPNETIRRIVQRCRDFDSFSITEAGVYEEMEIELVHEKEVEQEVEMAPDIDPAEHALHPNVERFVTTGDASLCHGSGFFLADQAFSDTSLVIPKGFNQFFSNIVVTEDFYRTINFPSKQSGWRMDRFIRSVDWVVTAETSPKSSLMVLFSPYEVEKLLPRFRSSTGVTLHVFNPRSNLSTPSLEDLNFLSLPSTRSTSPLSRPLAMQLNLFSGSLYFRDYETYNDVCRALWLHFGPVPAHLAKPDMINASFFVLDPQARLELGMAGMGFQENAIPFFQNMIRMRRYGRGFGLSHIGKVLHGNRLRESDFVGGDADMIDG